MLGIGTMLRQPEIRQLLDILRYRPLLITGLMSLNLTDSLVDKFTFLILLSTICVLIPYVFSAVSQLVIFARDREKLSGERLAGASVVAVLALVYSLWAITGAGRDAIFWGLLLLLAGVPFYGWQVRGRRSARGEAGTSDPERPGGGKG